MTTFETRMMFLFRFFFSCLLTARSTIQAFYSQGCKPLRAVTKPIANDNSGRGQYQIGILKKPTGTDDVVNSGFQASNLNEGLIYGGIFIEDSKNGCVSV